ncbi:phospholipase SGR2 isoform X2 [Nymphaea colorata]|uniref:phospholipase SGR2 isoform X2 n=1 Tax=Nymphaea colorata TaxID=210225 RepID=UPI00214E7967|nr:phospholipase SGR2 isoform X2 [Nymphaea colorata]
MGDPESSSRAPPPQEGGECSDAGGRYGVNGAAEQFPEAASPDSLKNTPSNIAKLEDIIEQSEGRQKYLARTKSPSDGEDVRWYFCKVPLAENELAASVPQTEIVGKSEYFRFSMRDSLALEASFLQREEDLLAAWWKEYAECSEGPAGSFVSSSKGSTSQSKPSPGGVETSIILAEEEERVGVPVKGGLYEVDLVKRHCFPVYWNGENRRVLRGHWFARKAGLEWLPLRENVAEQLELAYRCQVWHRRSFQPSGLFAARVDLQGSTQGLHALFTGEDDTWEAWLASDGTSFSNVISLKGHGIRLRRGYASSESSRPSQDELRQQKEELMDDYCAQVPVGHLVFMVHGIGQRLEKANLVDDVATFRHITASLAERHISSYQRSTQRVLFIPCQWRRGLKLDGESAVEKITLDGVRGLRMTLSATVHDVLYYMSPIYCQAIINSVSNQLNKLYTKFIKRNPGYSGKVSIYGHSLGSVLSYDILCHQKVLYSPFPMDKICKEYGLSGDAVLHTTISSSESSSGACPIDPFVAKTEAPEQAVNLKESNCPNSHLEPDPSEISETLNSVEEPYVVRLNEMSASDGKGLQMNDGLESICEQSRVSDSELYRGSESHCEVMKDDVLPSVDDKDKLIKSLAEEVNFLKEKIKDLTSQKNCSSVPVINAEVSGRAASEVPLARCDSLDQENSQRSYTPQIKYTKLGFAVDTFFAVGSPLGVFLALRNIRIGIGEGKDYWQGEGTSEEMPACRRMFNIFHPFDPVAYRIEPLICKEYINKRPVIVPYHKGGKRLHIGFQEFTEDLASRSQAVLRRINSMRIGMVNLFQYKRKIEDSTENIEDAKERTYGSKMMERLTGSEEGRIDHMLQNCFLIGIVSIPSRDLDMVKTAN